MPCTFLPLYLWPLEEFPVAAVPQTKCLKQQKCIVSQFWSPEVLIKLLAGLCSL